MLVHEKKLVEQDKEEQALKVSTDRSTSIQSWSVDRRGGRSSRKWGKGNKIGGRQYQNSKSNGDLSTSQGKGRGHDQQFDKSKVECYRCHKLGHYHSECYTKLP